MLLGNFIYRVAQTLINLLIHGDRINEIYCSDIIEEECIIGVLYFVMVTVQSILLTPLKVKL